LTPGQSGSITIRARISDTVPVGTTTIQDRFNIDSSETSLTYSNYVSTWVYKNDDPGNPSIDIEKQVRNVFSGTSFSETVNAEKNDEVEFSLEIRSTGNTVLVNVRVWDNLPSQLDYISGTTRVDGSYKGDGIIGSGIYIGDISVGSSKIVKFKARVEDQSYSYATTLTNYGYADADNTSSVNDTARVIIEDEDEQPDLGIEKLARNITRGTSYFTKTVYAKPGDEIEFLIRLNSTGDTTVENVRVMDDLPGKLRYINGSTTVNGFYKSDGITVGSGLFIGDIYLGNVKEIKFRVNVYDADNFYPDLTTLTNNVSAWATDVDRIRDYAFVKVEKQGEVGSPVLNISKSVRNISRGETSWINSTLASPSQEVEFLIEVTNTSHIDVTNARVWDALPAYLAYVSGSTYLDDSSTGSVLGTGLDIGTLSAGQTKKIRFKATISDIDNFGVGYTDLINTGYTSADNFSQISDTAIVRVYKPGEVKGATTVVTGANSFSLIFLALISALIAFFVYCRTREDRLLEILSENGRFKWLIRFYFRMKFFVTVTKLRFEKVYW
ncbi:DUF11 domain-containing protein, partial [Patescibacteria group bacterium]|nr:DUF11 domain-containing protein [Patescibacteria group bacterium]